MGILLKKYLWVAQLFLVFIGSYFLAKIAATFIASKLRIEKNLEVARISAAPTPARVRVGFDEYKIILDRNIFDSRELAPEVAIGTPEPAQLDMNAPAVKTSLPIKLVSTFSVGAGIDKRSTATVVGGAGGSAGEIYTVEDEKQFSPGVKIVKILPDRIEFVNGARLEYAEIERFGGGVTTGQPGSALDKPTASKTEGDAAQQTEQGKFVVDKAELDAALSNLDQLFTQIRAVPQMQGGKSTGLKLLSIRGGSIFAKLGLRRNDVLERINGQEMDMQKGMQIFGTLKDSTHITIDLQREGKKTTLEYDIQ
ncbi:MAG TPA: type II secretion system protein GspC [bacterium]|nr:type II secretion system protein GspC [bacterium]